MTRLTTVFALFLICGCDRPAAPTPGEATLFDVPAMVGAAGPRLTGGTDTTVVLSWMEPDNPGWSLRYSLLDGDGWTEPATVVSGRELFVNWADLPSVMQVSGEHWAAHWLEMAGSLTYSYHVRVTQSFDGGNSWSVAVNPHSDKTPTEHGFVSMYRQDDYVAAIWLDGRKTGQEPDGDPLTTGITLRGATITADGSVLDEQLIDELVCDCCQTDVLSLGQSAIALYRDRTQSEVRDIHIARQHDRQWQASGALNDDGWQIPGCPVNGPSLAAANDIVAATWFTMQDGTPSVRIRFSRDGAQTFGPVTEIAGKGAAGHVDSVLLDDGSAVVSWLQSTGAGLSDLRLQHVYPDGSPGKSLIARSGVLSRSVPQLARTDNALVLVWTELSGDEKVIRSGRVALGSLL